MAIFIYLCYGIAGIFSPAREGNFLLVNQAPDPCSYNNAGQNNCNMPQHFSQSMVIVKLKFARAVFISYMECYY